MLPVANNYLQEQPSNTPAFAMYDSSGVPQKSW